ncbi:MAG: LPD7 domain-containing protein, partial [Thioalkalivibrio sp.]
TWNTDIDLHILKSLKWVDVNARALTLKTGDQVQDHGDKVSLSKGSDDGIAAAIALAQSKGWESVTVNGSDDFQLRAALALREAGIKPRITSEIAKSLFSDELRKRDT